MVSDYLGKDLTPILDKKLYLLDMDGTIYIGNKLFDGVKRLLKKIKLNGGKYVFITNNSSKSVEEYVEKLSKLGVDCDESNFFTSTQASFIFMRDRFSDKLIYVQATKACVRELKKLGLNVTETYNEKAQAILVGFDREITGEKMSVTCEMLTKFELPYYATNPDWVCPVEFGYVPDCGSMCFGYEKATGKKPIFIGKPNPLMINLAMKKYEKSTEETIVIGDRIYTDIASGVNAGVDTVLVLSGEATIKDFEESEIKPTYLLNDISEIYKVIK